MGKEKDNKQELFGGMQEVDHTPVLSFAEVGRRRKYQNVEEMQAAIIEYFDTQLKNGRPLTIQGLALSLGFSSRQTLLNYEGYTGDDGKQFLDTIKKARLFIENYKVEGALLNTLNTTMVIFDLKNNYGYNDTQTRVVKGLEGTSDKELDERIKQLQGRLNDD